MKIPQTVIDLFNNPQSTKVLTTVSASGIPHSIVVGSIMAPSDNLLCAAEIMMKTTSENLKTNTKICAIAVNGKESYQIIASVKGNQKEGEIFDNINANLAKMNMSCNGVWLFEPLEVFDQSAGPNAGEKIL